MYNNISNSNSNNCIGLDRMINRLIYGIIGANAIINMAIFIVMIKLLRHNLLIDSCIHSVWWLMLAITITSILTVIMYVRYFLRYISTGSLAGLFYNPIHILIGIWTFYLYHHIDENCEAQFIDNHGDVWDIIQFTELYYIIEFAIILALLPITILVGCFQNHNHNDNDDYNRMPDV